MRILERGTVISCPGCNWNIGIVSADVDITMSFRAEYLVYVNKVYVNCEAANCDQCGAQFISSFGDIHTKQYGWKGPRYGCARE